MRRRASYLLLAVMIAAVWAGGALAGKQEVSAKQSPAKRPQAARPGRIEYEPGKTIAVLSNKSINESSGIAASKRLKGVFWTHNDSGGRPQLYAFNLKGEQMATLKLRGVTCRDWEDCASFTYKGRHILLVGDFGDNARKYKVSRIFGVYEPKLKAAKRNAKYKLNPCKTITFRFANGPQNCESMAADPTSGKIFLVSKTSGNRCKVYELPWAASTAGKPAVAKVIATLDVPTTTAMDISPDGLRAVVLTYSHAFEYVRKKDETWAQGFSRQPRILSMPLRAQGESICYGMDGATLYLTSETQLASKKLLGNKKLQTPLIEVAPVKAAAKDTKKSATAKPANTSARPAK